MASHRETPIRDIWIKGDRITPKKVTSCKLTAVAMIHWKVSRSSWSPGEDFRERGKAGLFIFLSEGKEMDEAVRNLPHEEEEREER